MTTHSLSKLAKNYFKPLALTAITFLFFLSPHLRADEPPVIPVGLDSYRMWDHWADQRIGVRAYMRSTYDRGGGNSDAANYLFQTADDLSVPLDVEGSGILYFCRYNHWHGSPWHYIVDETDHIIQEGSFPKVEGRIPGGPSEFIPGKAFPEPMAYTWNTTKGADLIWTPIPFEKSLRLAYGHTHYGTGYFIYDQFVAGTKLSSPIKAWDGETPPDQDVLDLINRSGTDLLPKAGSTEASDLTDGNGKVSIPKDGAVSVTDLSSGPTMLREISFSVPASDAIAFGRTQLRITWDNRTEPSVNAPIALFFGAGTLFNQKKSEYLVKAFPVHIHFTNDRVELACYFPMPFFKSARIELVGNGETPINEVKWNVRYAAYRDPPNHVGYFHATYRDHGQPERGKDLVLLDTRGTEGSTDWSGSFIGTSLIFSQNGNLETLEGDPRFYFDDSLSPQAQGTGTEEWGGGGDYWGGTTMTLPFVGHPVGAHSLKQAVNDDDKIESAYRFLLADLMPFGKNAVIQLEHGGYDNSQEHYSTVTYWYGLPAASLLKTDELKVGDSESEKSHGYASPEASEPYKITSCYEGGVDSSIPPLSTDTGRKTTGTSEFTLKLDPSNLGVMLRRKLDYTFANQRAEVFLADAMDTDKAVSESAWKPAGVWYTPGSATSVHSDPSKELGPAKHEARTYNRAFCDDEFLLPKDLTTGRSAIRVRIKFTPVHIPLYSGYAEKELAWSEIRYDAYSYVMPNFTLEVKK